MLLVPVFPMRIFDLGLAGWIKMVLYTAWIAAWGLMVAQKVINIRIRRYLLLLTFLMIFWMVVKGMKWYYVTDPDLIRWLWYLYYIPMLMLPLLSLYIAVLLGKPESERLPVSYRLLFVWTVLMILVVLTNDLHQKVFSFPEEALVWTESDYRYEAGYYMVAAWAILCGLSAFFLMLRKTRVLKNKVFLFASIFAVGFLIFYVGGYATYFLPRIFPLNDLAFIFCLCFTGVMESCIRSGLIPSNTHYEELFRLSTIDGQIADQDFSVLLASNQASPLPEEEVRRVIKSAEPVILENNIRLAFAPLKRGYVLWKEDITEISGVIEELNDMSEYLTARKAVLQKEVETSRREQLLTEKNRLYNALMDETQEEIDGFAALLDRMEETSDPVRMRKMAKRLAIICTHMKRRSNLIFLAEENGGIDVCELHHAMEEWISNLKLGGTVCGCLFDMKEPIVLSDMLFLYDAFQRILLFTLDTLESLFVNCSEKDGERSLLVTLTSREDFSAFPVPGVTIRDEDGNEKILEIMLPAAREERLDRGWFPVGGEADPGLVSDGR